MKRPKDLDRTDTIPIKFDRTPYTVRTGSQHQNRLTRILRHIIFISMNRSNTMNWSEQDIQLLA
jgi:hypothetical protein